MNREVRFYVTREKTFLPPWWEAMMADSLTHLVPLSDDTGLGRDKVLGNDPSPLSPDQPTPNVAW